MSYGVWFKNTLLVLGNRLFLINNLLGFKKTYYTNLLDSNRLDIGTGSKPLFKQEIFEQKNKLRFSDYIKANN